MKRSMIGTLALAAAICLIAQDRDSRERLHAADNVVVERNVMVPMRDGVKLATDIVRPKGEGRFPVILSRTPYGKKVGGAVRGGKIVAVQDVRGRYASEGEFYPFKHDPHDGYDTIEWLAERPWCDGNVYMVGGSYVGFTQLAAAMTNPPHLRAIMPAVPPSDFDNRTLFQGGVLRQSLAQGWLLGQSWKSQRVMRGEVPQEELNRWRRYTNFRPWSTHLPLSDPGPIAIGGERYAQSWTDIIDNSENPGYWEDYSAVDNPEKICVPVLITGGYYDIFSQGNLDLVLALRARGGSDAARGGSHLIMGPWGHGIGGPVGDVSFDEARDALSYMTNQWTTRWVRSQEGQSTDEWSAIYAYVIGQNRWIATDSWPPKESVPTKVYLSKGKLALQPPEAGKESSQFVYDPDDPVPTLAGNNLVIPRGITDHRPHAERDDVLRFESEPLEDEVVMVGPLKARLFVSTTAPDTDFTAMLLDVRPDGYRVNIQDGIVRLRYRNGRSKPQIVEPGQVIEIDIDLWSTGYAVKKGHRIALHVSSSNFPRFARHMNTSEPPWEWTQPQKATNTVYHDAAHPSYIELPLMK
jgi:putative CocE/NonD family hydrolase